MNKILESSVGSDLDYSINWKTTGLMLKTGEDIASSSWTVTPNTGTINLHDPSVSNGVATVFISNGEANVTYVVTNSIVTNSTPPRSDNLSFFVRFVAKKMLQS